MVFFISVPLSLFLVVAVVRLLVFAVRHPVEAIKRAGVLALKVLHLAMLFLAIVGWVSYFKEWSAHDLLLGQPFVLWMAGFCTAAVVLLSVLLNHLEGYRRPAIRAARGNGQHLPQRE